LGGKRTEGFQKREGRNLNNEAKVAGKENQVEMEKKPPKK